MRLIEIFENQEAEAEPQYKREMTHEQFIQFMNRSGGVYDWLLDYSRPPIWRGSREGFEAAFINPRATGRRSANTTNYYTVFTSNHPSWSQFPPRNASMISATNSTLASGYGKAYVVLLPKNARVGVCPEDDFWNSFPVIADNVPDIRGPQELNSFMMVISKYTDYYQMNITEYGDLMDFFSQLDDVLAGKRGSWTPHTPGNPMPLAGDAKIDVRFRNGDANSNVTAGDYEWGRIGDTPDAEIIAWRRGRPGAYDIDAGWYKEAYQWFQSQYNAGKSYMEIYAALMDPQSNGFSITTANDPALAKNQYQEVWFESDCVMVNYWSWQQYQKIRTQQDMES